MVTWDDLSDGERKCLAFDNLNLLSTAMFTSLFDKGLVYKAMENGEVVYCRTELGNRVLLQVNGHSLVISVAEFVSNNYAEKIASGECKAKYKGSTIYGVSKKADDVYYVLFTGYAHAVPWRKEVTPDFKFTVIWRKQQ